MDPMGATNHLLREILQEIRDVKAYVIPAPETRYSVLASAGGGENENENCPAESFSGPPQLPNATRNTRLMGRMTKEEQKGLSKEDRKRRCELKKMASEERKASRSPEEQAKIDARVAAMQAGRAISKAAAGGGPSAEESVEERKTRKRKNRRNLTQKNYK
jgi:hypothetical protein